MSDAVTLTLRAPLTERVEVDGVTPDRCAELSNAEIGALPVWVGSRRAQLGDVFEVQGERAARVRIEGALARVDGLGAGTTTGELVVDGDAGARVAAGMTGGSVEVRGDVGDDAGLAMAGGVLRVTGSAGDRLGGPTPGASKGMTGGEIVVLGSAGREATARARRGLVVVGGDVGADAARAMIAGTLVVRGRVTAEVGRGNKRGSVVALGGITIPATYHHAYTGRLIYVRLLVTHLRRRHGLSIGDDVLNGRYRRHCGDAGEPGKGEILEWVT